MKSGCVSGLLLLPLLAGCSVAGKWSLASIEPEAVRRDFEFQSLTLQRDGTFYAEEEDKGIKTTSGQYTFKEGVLALKAHDGEQHAYDATVTADTLYLEQLLKGQKVKARFIRKE